MCNALEIPQMWGPTQSKVLLYISLTVASVCIMTSPTPEADSWALTILKVVLKATPDILT